MEAEPQRRSNVMVPSEADLMALLMKWKQTMEEQERRAEERGRRLHEQVMESYAEQDRRAEERHRRFMEGCEKLSRQFKEQVVGGQERCVDGQAQEQGPGIGGLVAKTCESTTERVARMDREVDGVDERAEEVVEGVGEVDEGIRGVSDVVVGLQAVECFDVDTERGPRFEEPVASLSLGPPTVEEVVEGVGEVDEGIRGVSDVVVGLQAVECLDVDTERGPRFEEPVASLSLGPPTIDGEKSSSTFSCQLQPAEVVVLVRACEVEVRPSEEQPFEVRPFEVRSFEERPFEVRPFEVGPCKVRSFGASRVKDVGGETTQPGPVIEREDRPSGREEDEQGERTLFGEMGQRQQDVGVETTQPGSMMEAEDLPSGQEEEWQEERSLLGKMGRRRKGLASDSAGIQNSDSQWAGDGHRVVTDLWIDKLRAKMRISRMKLRRRYFGELTPRKHTRMRGLRHW